MSFIAFPVCGGRCPKGAEGGFLSCGACMSNSPDDRPYDLIERMSLWLSAFCLIGMTSLMLLEVILRGVFNSTTEHSDELVGYLLIGISFLSLALCQSRGAFHRVEMVQMRLGPRGKAVSALVFDLLSFAYIALTELVLPAVRHELLPARGRGADRCWPRRSGSPRRRWSWAPRCC